MPTNLQSQKSLNRIITDYSLTLVLYLPKELSKDMPNKNNGVFQTSQYDKIIRENLEQTLPVIIKDLLHLNIVETEEIPDDIQHTKERKPDALKKVTDSEGNTYILHLEFQVPNKKEMVYRMAEYSIITKISSKHIQNKGCEYEFAALVVFQ